MVPTIRNKSDHTPPDAAPVKTDDAQITKIHNKYYDISKFNHPGGPIAMACAIGRDSTELFESHHQFTSKDMSSILE